MKTFKLFAFALGVTTVAFGTTPKDYQTTTKDSRITVVQNGVASEKKVKVVITKEQHLEFNPLQKYNVNQNRVTSPIKVTKLILLGDLDTTTYNQVLALEYVTASQSPIRFDKGDYEFDKYLANGALNTTFLKSKNVDNTKILQGYMLLTDTVDVNADNRITILKDTKDHNLRS
jgi:hypothetical protein